jgi:hypothetical protein
VQYKKAYERLKEAFELQIDETLLEECRSLHSKYQNYDNLTNLIEPITSEDGTLDRLVFSNGKEIFGKVIEEDEDNITFEQSNGIRGKIPRHRLAQIEELSSEKVQIRFLRNFVKKRV